MGSDCRLRERGGCASDAGSDRILGQSTGTAGPGTRLEVERAMPASESGPLRHLADALSGANLVCGLLSIACAVALRFEACLALLLLGAIFDGLDGAAARRFGGTRIGVYADDVADGVNYGLAPGAALAAAIGGLEGLVVGAFYAVFTIGRLVYFTLDKDEGDPRFFPGVPSTVGGLVSLSAVLLFPDRPAWIGLSVGVACAQMVSFRTHYRHLGRALASRELPRRAAALLLALWVGGGLAWGVRGSAAAILAASLLYGFLPSWLAFRANLGRSWGKPQPAPEAPVSP
jgi:CDP-diacylglycerol--serine O-phosphatidyltransferase